jgi:hypothetical protein
LIISFLINLRRGSGPVRVGVRGGPHKEERQ